MAVTSDLLSSLEQVVQLRKVSIRIALIHQGVEVFQGFPHAHLPAVTRKELLPFRLREIKRLMPMIQPIKFADRRPRVRLIIPELLLFLGWINPVKAGSRSRLILRISLLEK